MMTYSLLNLVFFVALLGIYLYTRRMAHAKAALLATVLVVALTAVFDPIMIALGIVAYDANKLLGLYWFGAPIEDFAYAFFAVPFVAAVWTLLERRDVR